MPQLILSIIVFTLFVSSFPADAFKEDSKISDQEIFSTDKKVPYLTDVYNSGANSLDMDALGMDALDRGEFDKAEKMYKSSMQTANRQGNEQAQVKALLGLSLSYLMQKKFQKIITEIEPMIDECSDKVAPSTRAILYLHVGVAYAMQGSVSEGERKLRIALISLQNDITTDNQIENTVLIQKLLTIILIETKQHTEAQQLLEKNWANYIMIGRADNLTRDFTNSLLISLRGQNYKDLTVFYGKTLGGHILFNEYQESSNTFKPDNDIFLNKILKQLFILSNTIEKDTQFQAILNSPNTSGDTPYNKGRAWMRGPEIELYAKYGEVASALAQAGKSGTESEKETARKNFQNWFGEVEKILGDK